MKYNSYLVIFVSFIFIIGSGCSDEISSTFPNHLTGSTWRDEIQTPEGANIRYAYQFNGYTMDILAFVASTECNWNPHPGFDRYYWQMFQGHYNYDETTGSIQIILEPEKFGTYTYSIWEPLRERPRNITYLDLLDQFPDPAIHYAKGTNPEVDGRYIHNDSLGNSSLTVLNVDAHRSGLCYLTFDYDGFYFIEMDFHRNFDSDIPALVQWCGTGEVNVSNIWDNRYKIDSTFYTANQLLQWARSIDR